MRLSRKIIIVTISIILLCVITLQVFIAFTPYYYQPINSDGILILGYALVDGTYPDNWLKLRLEKGLELYNKGYAKYIIVSGGQGSTDHLPVAEAMRTWLVEHNAPQDRILLECSSHNTFENMKFSRNIASNYNINSVIVVTSDFHIFRSMLVARKFFKNCSAASAPSNGTIKRWLSYLREAAAVLKYTLFNRI